MQNRPTMVVAPGDGVGQEVTREAVRVLEWFTAHRGFDCDLKQGEFGIGLWHRTGHMMPDGLLADMVAADAVLFGAVGGDADHRAVPQEVRRNEGLLRVRKEMAVYANIRPVKVFPALAGASALREEVTQGVDLVVLRELIGGIYFGEPRGIETLPDGQRRGFNTQSYTTSEIHRIGRVGFELAAKRRGQLMSVDKANVMESGALWREEMERLHREEFPHVGLAHMYVDNCSMQIIRNPRQFDVIVTDNLFGDILSDCASSITGSLGMLPSASLSDIGASGRRCGLFEPVHGSAPDIAGQDKANPIASILSLGMAFDLALGRSEDARLLEQAVEQALARRNRTADIAEPGATIVSTRQMGQAVLDALHELTH